MRNAHAHSTVYSQQADIPHLYVRVHTTCGTAKRRKQETEDGGKGRKVWKECEMAPGSEGGRGDQTSNAGQASQGGANGLLPIVRIKERDGLCCRLETKQSVRKQLAAGARRLPVQPQFRSPEPQGHGSPAGERAYAFAADGEDLFVYGGSWLRRSGCLLSFAFP